MKRTTCVLLGLTVVAFGAVTIGGITDTAHDFRGETWYTSDQICLPCHVPHHAMTETDGSSMVLWNHELTGETFTMYSPFALDRTDRDQDTNVAAGPSRLCLSCHDGVTAVDSYGGTTGSTVMGDIGTGSGDLTTDLRDDHPIGIAYPTTEPGYNDKATLAPVKLVSWGGKDDRVECTSCHDPHSDTYVRFLREDLTASAICLKCHNK